MIYTLDSFDPQYAGKPVHTVYNLMFEYREPGFLEKVTAMLGREPHDVTISLNDEGIHMMLCDDDAMEMDDACIVFDYCAGRDMLTWLLQGKTPAEIAAISQKILLTLAFMPTERGGVSLCNLEPEEQARLREAWQFIKSYLTNITERE